ncbi:META domain-containing protein [Kribbella sp. WER1]
MSVRGILGLVTAMVVLSACGAAAGRSATYALGHTPELSDLTDATWVAHSIVNRGIVAGSVIQLTFTGDTVTAEAGCNTLTGAASIDNHELIVSAPATTRKACDPALQAQDRWLAAFLAARPTIERQGNELWLSRRAEVLHLTS